MNDKTVKVTFSPEFIEKTKYKKTRMSHKKKAQLLKMKFESLTSEKLSKAHTVSDLIRLLGLDTTNNNDRNYVKKLINEKKILEYPTGEKRGMARICDYSFPSSDPRSHENEVSFPAEKPEEVKASKITITVGEVNITLEEPTSEMVEIVFKNLGIFKESC